MAVPPFFCSLSDKLSSGRESLDTAGPGKALLVGVVQMVAIFPGISRSGSTITGGLFAGFRREDAVRFSFLLSIPAILGANLLKLPDLFETGLGGESALPMLLGVAAADAVFVDDVIGNLRGAQALGMRCIQMRRNMPARYRTDVQWDGPVAHNFAELEALL